MGCGAFSPAKRFCCEKNLRNLRQIFVLASVAIFIAWRAEMLKFVSRRQSADFDH